MKNQWVVPGEAMPAGVSPGKRTRKQHVHYDLPKLRCDATASGWASADLALEDFAPEGPAVLEMCPSSAAAERLRSGAEPA